MSETRERLFLDGLRAALHRTVPHARRFAVAFSGGLDSTVLLAAMTRLPAVESLRALHVDHGLHPDSAEWERRCRRVCAEWSVPFRSVRIVVDRAARTGLEAAARDARYAALAELLAEGETLLTAHHADDQLETLLLRLLRGTGVRGLRGILPRAPLGRGEIVRPLLAASRAEIRAIAEDWMLDWLEDPSNRSLEHDRNLVRAKLLPVIRERWGDAALRSAARLAAAMGDAEEILVSVAEADLAAAGAVADRVPLAPLRALQAARRRNALRHAIRRANLPMPNADRLERLCAAIAESGPGARARVQWPGGEARVYRDRLYLLAAPRTPERSAERRSERSARAGAERARVGAPLAAPAGRVSAESPWEGPEGRLVLEPVDAPDAGEGAAEAASAAPRGAAAGDPRTGARAPEAAGMPESWARQGLDVRFRAGGERFKPAGDAHHRSLKHWFQQRGIVPWMRDRVPLLYRGDRLVAVADLALDDEALRAAPAEPRWRVRWHDHPRID
ncbi:MAG TPA: tRNA lysidine(34) synthetase TilS [Gammaproteobacteria bacterium]